VLALLIERGLTLATMESITGGLLTSLLTDVPGSSNAFVGGLVAYSNMAKEQWGVPAETIAAFGAISVETARAMAQAARSQLGANLGVGITGVAGPDTQEDEPVGTVHIAVASAERTSDTSQRFRGARTEIKSRTAYTALSLLRLHLLREG
jgi:nicotinamide-nucleotide amidase